MQQQHRQAFSFIFILFLMGASGCAALQKKNKVLKRERQATVDYQIVSVSRTMPEWAAEFYLLQAKDKLKDNSFLWTKSDEETQEFIIDSGARVEQEVACPVVRAQAREVVAEKISLKLFEKVKGRPYDTVIKGKGLSILMNQLKGILNKDSVVGVYEEGRSFPGNDRIKGQDVFHCALKISVSTKTINAVVSEIKESIKKDYFHLVNLEEELGDLKLP